MWRALSRCWMSVTNVLRAPKPACGLSTVNARSDRKPSIWGVRACVTLTRTGPADRRADLLGERADPALDGLDAQHVGLDQLASEEGLDLHLLPGDVGPDEALDLDDPARHRDLGLAHREGVGEVQLGGGLGRSGRRGRRRLRRLAASSAWSVSWGWWSSGWSWSGSSWSGSHWTWWWPRWTWWWPRWMWPRRPRWWRSRPRWSGLRREPDHRRQRRRRTSRAARSRRREPRCRRRNGDA